MERCCSRTRAALQSSPEHTWTGEPGWSRPHLQLTFQTSAVTSESRSFERGSRVWRKSGRFSRNLRTCCLVQPARASSSRCCRSGTRSEPPQQEVHVRLSVGGLMIRTPGRVGPPSAAGSSSALIISPLALIFRRSQVSCLVWLQPSRYHLLTSQVDQAASAQLRR